MLLNPYNLHFLSQFLEGQLDSSTVGGLTRLTFNSERFDLNGDFST